MPAKAAKIETAAAPERAIDLGVLPSLIGYHLRKAQLAVFQDFARAVGAAEVTPGQFGVLMVIDRNPGLSQTRLGQTLGIDRSTLVTVIDRLEARGLVERADAPKDRRSYALHLSGRGRNLLAELTDTVRDHEQQVARDLTAAERLTLIALLRRIGKPVR
jgi:DNA-binding MarR family transcriptional regulator